MYDYEYVKKKEYQPIKNKLIDLIRLVQDEVHDKFTFNFAFVGSSSRNMVTRIKGGNRGYDFDVDIFPNVDIEEYTEKEIKHILMNAFNRHIWPYCFDNCEDNTRVFTIKVKDMMFSKIIYSCDFAIVRNFPDGRQKYIRRNKKQNSYYWEYQPKDCNRVFEKFDEINKYPDIRNELNELYLEKKRNNDNTDKKSRSLFAEAVNEVYHRNFED